MRDLKRLSEIVVDLSGYGVSLAVLRKAARADEQGDKAFPAPVSGSANAGYRYDFAEVRSWAEQRYTTLTAGMDARDLQAVRWARAGMSKRAGLYFAQCGVFVKIGIAQDLATRLSAIQVGNPYPVSMLGSILEPSGRRRLEMEREWHAQWDHMRHRGEWFRLSMDLLVAIKAASHD